MKEHFSGLSIQFDSFNRFFEKGSSYEFSLQRIVNEIFPLKHNNSGISINMDFEFRSPLGETEGYLAREKTYSGKLLLKLSLHKPNGKMITRDFVLAAIPCPTPDSEFIISGQNEAHRKVVIMQLARAFGIHYSEKIKEDFIEKECLIIPVLSDWIKLNWIDKKVFVKVGELTLPLKNFADILGLQLPEVESMNEILNGSEQEAHALRAVYTYMERKKLLKQNEIFMNVDCKNEKDLEFVKQRFRDYIQQIDIAKMGKVRTRFLLKKGKDSIDIEHTKLTLEELAAIISAFCKIEIAITEDRSLKNKRVKLIGDFLFEIFYRGLKKLRKEIEHFIESYASEQDNVSEDDLINKIPIDDSIHDEIEQFFANSELCQILDTTNPLAEMSHKRRITLKGPGGMPDDGLFLKERDTYPEDFGRICPIETPQGQNLGYNLYLARDARINESGMIEALLKTKDNEEKVYIDPLSDDTLVICTGEMEASTIEQIFVKKGDEELCSGSWDEVTHRYEPDSFLGYSTSLVPFIENDDATRTLMGVNMMKQAVLLKYPEAPFIKTGYERKLTEVYGKKSDFIKNGELCLGRNFLVGYMPWDLQNYEDGIVVSETCRTCQLLTSVETEEFIVDERYDIEEGIFEEITNNNPHIVKDHLNNLNDGITLLKQIKVGDILVSKVRSHAKREKKTRQDQYATFHFKTIMSSKELENKIDVSFKSPVNGKIENITILTCKTAILPRGVKKRVIITISNIELPVNIGDKITGRHGNKGVISQILPEREMPYFKSATRGCKDKECKIVEPHTHLEILLNPLGVTSRMNLGQLYETALGWAAYHDKAGAFNVPSFSNKFQWVKIKEILNNKNLQDKQKLFFWKEKEIEISQSVTVGYQYFCKLKHYSEDKLKVHSRYFYGTATGQPDVPIVADKMLRRSVAKKTAQRLGEMEVWALEGHRAWHILDECLAIKSDVEDLRSRFKDFVRDTDEKVQKVRTSLMAYFSGKGYEVEEQGLDLIVTVSNTKKSEDVRKQCAEQGFSMSQIDDNKYRLSYDPIYIWRRENKAFKTLIHYLRVIGFEIDCFDNEGKKINLLKLKEKGFQSRINKVVIRIAKDTERESWARKAPLTSGDFFDERGIWSQEIFADEDKDSGIIELACPVLNPLFYSELKLLLSGMNGYHLNHIESEMLEVMKSLGLNYRDFKNNHLKDSTVLVTSDDLCNMIAAFLKTQDKSTCSDKYIISSCLTKHLPPPSKFEEMIHTDSPVSLCPSQLYKVLEGINIDNKIKSLLDAKPLSKDERILDLLQSFKKNGYKLTDLFITKLIVVPRALRWERQEVLDKKVSSIGNDLNQFYRQIIWQNERLRKMKNFNAPKAIVNDAEKILQKRVHALFCNEKLESPFKAKSGRVLKSILGHIKGKEGIFRKHLLGKKVDFSGRAVIIPDPNLTIDKVGVPYALGKEIFSDILIKRALKQADVFKSNPNTKYWNRTQKELEAKKYIYDMKNSSKIKSWLDEIANDSYVILNRAPSLHRLSVLAFRPKFFDGDFVLRLNTFVCKPFNADFDGDTMAIHVPMLPASKEEAARMCPPDGLISPANGSMIISCGADISLAVYLLTFRDKHQDDNDIPFMQFNEIIKKIEIKELCDTSIDNVIYSNYNKLHNDIVIDGVTTTFGRLLFRWAFQAAKNIKVVNKTYEGKSLTNLLENVYSKTNREEFIAILENLKKILRPVLNICGLTLGIEDFSQVEFPTKRNLIQTKQALVNFCKEEDQRNKIWSGTMKELEKLLLKNLKADNPLYWFKNSGSAKVDLVQLCGMRGLMRRPNGITVKEPVKSSLLEGMHPFEYFISTHGSRHGLADKSLMTAPAGDLTNRLISAVQGEMIFEEDCGTDEGIYFTAFLDWEGGEISLKDRIKGRYLAEDIVVDRNIIYKGTEITDEIAKKIQEEHNEVKLRSPVTCNGRNWNSSQWKDFLKNIIGKKMKDDNASEITITEEHLQKISRKGKKEIEVIADDGKVITIDVPIIVGICQKCYGIDLSTNSPPSLNTPVGIIAGQSIGEPGTQLTLRTFHRGGVEEKGITEGLMQARRLFHLWPVKETTNAVMTGECSVQESKNALKYIEIKGKLDGKETKQRIHIVNIVNYLPVLSGCEVQVKEGQSLFNENSYNRKESINAKEIYKKYGLAATVEYLLYSLQKIYNAQSKVADHHFEVIIRKMLDGGSPKGILRVIDESHSFLAGASFLNSEKHLVKAALKKKEDYLEGVKEKILTCQILSMEN